MNILCNGIKQIYDGKCVLNIEELHIKNGSLHGIIGPNGAGKSTLLSILASLNIPVKGHVLYDGQSISNSIRKNITMVFQKPVMLKSSVEYNISYPLKIRGYTKFEVRKIICQIMEDFELTELAGQNACTLSGGEKQKVALARALSFSPKLLLLDEPTASIDRQSIKIMENNIIKANKNGTTVIIITHSVPQAARICSDVAFMYNGNICEHNNTGDLLYSPLNIHTKEFIMDLTL